MTLPLSQLIYAKLREAPGDRRVITLHRYNELLDGVREIGLAVNPNGPVIGLQASKGVYLSRNITGYMWFVGPHGKPSPVHFCDAMQEIERFLWDEIDRQESEAPVLPFLVGVEQGGMMALAMAAAVPDLISGVVAIDTFWPDVPGWEPPLAPLDGLPILVVDPAAVPVGTKNVIGGPEIAARFEGWGGRAKTLTSASGFERDAAIAAWLSAQPVRSKRA